MPERLYRCCGLEQIHVNTKAYRYLQAVLVTTDRDGLATLGTSGTSSRQLYDAAVALTHAAVETVEDLPVPPRFVVVEVPPERYNGDHRYVVADLRRPGAPVPAGPSPYWPALIGAYVGEAKFGHEAVRIADALEAHPDPSAMPADPDREAF